jgi:hypothetical protein
VRGRGGGVIVFLFLFLHLFWAPRSVGCESTVLGSTPGGGASAATAVPTVLT